MGALPDLADRRVGAQSELHDKARNVAEKRGVGEESMLHEIVEAVGANGSPSARDIDDEIALRRHELHLKRFRRLRSECSRMQQSGIAGHVCCPWLRRWARLSCGLRLRLGCRRDW